MTQSAYDEVDALLAEGVRQRSSSSERGKATQTLRNAALACRPISQSAADIGAKHRLCMVLWHLADHLFQYEHDLSEALVAGREGVDLSREVLSRTHSGSSDYPEVLELACRALNDLSVIAGRAELYEEQHSLLAEAAWLCRRSNATRVREVMGYVLHNLAAVQFDHLSESIRGKQATEDQVRDVVALALEAVDVRSGLLHAADATSHLALYYSQALAGSILCCAGDGPMGLRLLAETWSESLIFAGTEAESLRLTIRRDVDRFASHYGANVTLSGDVRVMSLLSPDEIARMGGTPPEAIAAVYDASIGPPALSLGSAAFVTLLHEVVRSAFPREPSANESVGHAMREGVDQIFIVDVGSARALTEHPPLEDVVGIFRIVGGGVSENTYLPNPRYAVYSKRREANSSTRGLVHLPEGLHAALLTRLRSIAAASAGTRH
jgi:hypothetical protein